MLPTKANIVCLLEILMEYSDEENILTMEDILVKFKNIYGMTIDRRTVYSGIEILNQLGYDISTYKENGKGYYIRSRQFELSEIRLLMDVVYSFKSIPVKQSEDLVKKLQGLLSVNKRKNYKNLTLIKSNSKIQNKEVFYNIDILDEAISNKMKVGFTYLKYNMEKELVPRRKRKYIVNPYGLLHENERYYLLCIMEYTKNISFYRVDLMKDIEIIDKPLDNVEKKIDIDKCINESIYMFTGKPETIQMKCDEYILGHVIDKFGQDITIIGNDVESFIVTTNVSPKGVKFWALQYLPYVEILSPEWLRNEIIESIKENKYNI